MIERLNNIELRYKEIENELMSEEVLKDVKKTKELSIERSSLEDVYEVYQEYKKILKGIEDSKEMIHDPELGEMAKEELNELETKKQEYDSKFEILLLPSSTTMAFAPLLITSSIFVWESNLDPLRHTNKSSFLTNLES